jgi:hypothetical protein
MSSIFPVDNLFITDLKGRVFTGRPYIIYAGVERFETIPRYPTEL